jgi:hypothetical protein
MTSTTHCTVCGCVPSAVRPAYTWSMTVTGTDRIWTCSACVRAQLIGIESGVAVSSR